MVHAVARGGLAEMVTAEQRPGEGEGVGSKKRESPFYRLEN